MSADYKLLETVADIAYCAGDESLSSGNSREDISQIIMWAREFEQKHIYTDWDQVDYMLEVERFALDNMSKLKISA